MSLTIEDLYRQDMITNNYTSNMLEGVLGGSSSDSDNSIAGILGGLSGTSALSGTGLDISSLLGGTTGVGGLSFANILDQYVKTYTTENQEENAKWVETLSGVLQDVEETGDHTKSTKTVQELYEYFQDKMSSGANGFSSLVQAAMGSTGASSGTKADSSDVTAGTQFEAQIPDVGVNLIDEGSIESAIESAISGSILG